MKKFLEIINVIIIVLTLYVAILAGILVLPRYFGIMPYIVLSGSMEPTIQTGAVAYIDQHDTDVDIGDVITYRLDDEADIDTGNGMVSAQEGTLVTHRLIGISEETGNFIMKGDANESTDLSEVTQSQIVGTYKFSIPKIGVLFQKIGSRMLTVVLVGLLALNVMTSVLIWAWKDDEKKEEEKKEEKQEEEKEPEEERETEPSEENVQKPEKESEQGA